MSHAAPIPNPCHGWDSIAELRRKYNQPRPLLQAENAKLFTPGGHFRALLLLPPSDWR
jgi:hypothetical protein